MITVPTSVTVVALAAVTLAVGCGKSSGSSDAPSAAPEHTAPAPTTTASPAKTAAPHPTAAPTAAAHEGRRAATTPLAGAEPLTEAESKEFEGPCKPLGEAVLKAEKAAKRSDTSDEVIDQVIAHPPALKGVDAAHCGKLTKRVMHERYAKKAEAEATAGLHRIAEAMEKSWNGGKKLCESAGPVPAEPASVHDKKYQSAPKDWETGGWKCLDFSLSEPQFYQYEVKTDAAAGTYRATARGHAWKGAPLSELFVEGHVDGGKFVGGFVMRP